MTRGQGKRNKFPHMSMGMALIEARKLLGPSGHVRRLDLLTAGTFDERGWAPIANGWSWEAALTEVRNLRGN